MTSKKQRRYGSGGHKHLHKVNPIRKNGKASKQHPKAFDQEARKLRCTAC